MLKRVIAGAAIAGLCIAATSQINTPQKRTTEVNLDTDSMPGEIRSGTTELSTTRLITGLARPVYVTHDGVNPDWIYVVEQRSGSTGRVKLFNRENGSLISTFLSVSNLNTGSEQGLLGLAFAPDYETSGHFYVNYTQNSRTYVTRYTRSSSNPQVADPSSAEVVQFISQPYSNHNGGWIEFGPDGYLYISNGDGGSGGDPGNRAQDITGQLLGKMLRIDVSTLPYTIPPDNPFVGQTGDDEIWCYGLRNAWRCSFDRENGNLWMGDVGQNAWEEVDFQSASSTGGENWGWRCYEGDNSYNTSGCDSSSTMAFPIWEYSHGGSPYRCSLTGGYVYRGSSIPSLQGTYFFGDYCSNQIWSFRYDGLNVTDYTDRTNELTPNAGSIGAISSFGEDYYGELYICDLNGEVFRLGPDTPTGACCFNEQCITSTAAQCSTVGGKYLGDGVNCDTDACLTPPENDDCSNAIAAQEGPNTYDTENATDSSYSDSCIFGSDIWFSFNPLYDGTMLVSNTGTLFTPMTGLYASCPSGNDQALICSDTSFIWQVFEANTYYFRVGNGEGDTGIGQLQISVIPESEDCPGDCNGDDQRDVNDILALIAAFGQESDCDIDGDGIISVTDLLEVLAVYGTPCE